VDEKPGVAAVGTNASAAAAVKHDEQEADLDALMRGRAERMRAAQSNAAGAVEKK
jgi:hypothetical protein